MIHIPFGHEAPSQAWLEKRKISEQLDAAENKQERDQIIDGNSKLWGELKDWLLKFSNGKCWFSEARTLSPTGRRTFQTKKELQRPKWRRT